jgi:lipopolysaccharide transport system ATP-binding protein
MYVRLAFAVAAHLDPEILLVDEVLAVGDAEFQRKCLGKMGSVAQEGRTVLFVSHNMGAVTMLCNRAICFANGGVVQDGPSAEVTNKYLAGTTPDNGLVSYPTDSNHVHFTRAFISSDGNTPQAVIPLSLPIHVVMSYRVPTLSKQVQLVCHVWHARGTHVMSTADIDSQPELLSNRENGDYRTEFQIPPNTLAPGRYRLTLACGIPNVQLLDEQEGPSFEISDVGSYAAKWSGARRDVLLALPIQWTTGRVSAPASMVGLKLETRIS